MISSHSASLMATDFEIYEAALDALRASKSW